MGYTLRIVGSRNWIQLLRTGVFGYRILLSDGSIGSGASFTETILFAVFINDGKQIGLVDGIRRTLGIGSSFILYIGLLDFKYDGLHNVPVTEDNQVFGQSRYSETGRYQSE